MKTCSCCKASNNDAALFCIECGAPFYKICPSCKSQTLFKSKFCPCCGQKFDYSKDALEFYKKKLDFFDYFINIDTQTGEYAIIKKNGLYGIINLNNFIITIPCNYISFDSPSSKSSYLNPDPNDFVLLKRYDNKWELFNPFTGKLIIDSPLDDYKIEENQRDIKIKKDGLWGRISSANGEIILPVRYDEISHAGTYGSSKDTGYIDHVKVNNYWGVVESKLGKYPVTRVPIEYIELHTWRGNDQPRPSQNREGKWGVINNNGSILVDFVYDEIKYHEPFGHSLYYLRKKNHWGLFFSGAHTRKDRLYPCIYTYDQITNITTVH